MKIPNTAKMICNWFLYVHTKQWIVIHFLRPSQTVIELCLQLYHSPTHNCYLNRRLGIRTFLRLERIQFGHIFGQNQVKRYQPLASLLFRLMIPVPFPVFNYFHFAICIPPQPQGYLNLHNIIKHFIVENSAPNFSKYVTYLWLLGILEGHWGHWAWISEDILIFTTLLPLWTLPQ